MSYRRMMYVPLVLLFLMTAGCAALSPVDESSPEEMQKAETSKDDLWNQTKALEKEKADYQKRLADQQEEIARMAKELADQQNEIAQANKQVGELNKSVDELSAQMRQVQEARQREHPLQITDLAPKKKETATRVKKTRSPKKQVRKAAPAAKAQKPQSTDMSAMMKQVTDAKQKLAAEKGVAEAPEQKKEAEAPREKIVAAKQEAKSAAPAAKARESGPQDDLSLQMKLFEEAEQKDSAAKEPGAVQAKKGTIKEDIPVKGTKQIARNEPAEKKPPQQKALKIKVLAGDGNIASAKGLSKRLGKMGYRVSLTDKAPRSDFDETVVYYGNEHRAAAQTMAKRMGGAAIRPLTWSSEFDIIVVTGRQP